MSLASLTWTSRETPEGVIKLAFAAEKKKSMDPEVSVQPTVHTNPDWMRDLKQNFSIDIIQCCSQRTRTAVENNEDVEVANDVLKVILFYEFRSEFERA